MKKACPRCGQYKLESYRTIGLRIAFCFVPLSIGVLWILFILTLFMPHGADVVEWFSEHGFAISFWELFRWLIYIALAIGVIALFQKGEVCGNCGMKVMSERKSKTQ